MRASTLNTATTLLATVVLLLGGPQPGLAAEDGPSLSAVSRARHFLEDLQRLGQKLKPGAGGTPAVSGAVAVRGELVFSNGAGMIDLENQAPASGISVYNIGSLSKAITAIAVMQLVERKQVSLDDDIRSYVPDLPDKGATITVWNALTHTSGLRHYRPSDFPGTPDNENIQPTLSWRDGLRIFAAEPLLFAPGKFFFYSSYAVNLLQGVVEKASGEPFERYLHDHIWAPAGASSGSVDIPERVVPHRARSYRTAGGQWFNYYYNDLRYKLASGGMIASVEDLARVGAALNHDLLLRPETRARMLTPQIDGVLRFREGRAPSPVGFQQAMLWRVQRDTRGRRFAYECGSVRGFNACLIDYPDEDLVAAIATNSFECCGWRNALTLADMFRTPGLAEASPSVP